jgi:hypothetical protein
MIRAFAPLLVTLLAQSAPYVIPPGQEERLARVFGDPPIVAECRWTGTSVEGNVVRAGYSCAGRDFHVSLVHPGEPHSEARTIGRTDQFDVLLGAGEQPPAGFTDAIVARVRANEANWQWVRPANAVHVDRAEMPHESRLRSAGKFALVCIVYGLAMALAALLARTLRRRTSISPARRRGIALATSALLLALPFVVVPLWPHVGIYDPLTLAAAFAAVLLARTLPRDVEPLRAGLVALASVILLVGFVGLEAWARHHPIRRPFPARRSEPHLVLTNDDRDFRCNAIYALHEPAFLRYRAASQLEPPREGARRVLHLGDSMIEAYELPADMDPPHRLSALRAPDEHFDLGVSALGTDAELAILRTWLPRLHPTEVVLHLFPGNDVADLDAPFACCNAGPLLEADAAVSLRCPQPSWHATFASVFNASPPPYAIRLCAQWSELCSVASYRHQVAVRPRSGPFVEHERLDRMIAILRAIDREVTAAGISWTISVLPVREGYVHPPAVERSHVLERVRASGLPFVDPAPAFERAMHEHPRARWFQPMTSNPHFDVDGSQFYAAWLADTLWPR